MSFDLAVVSAQESPSAEQVAELYYALCDGNYENSRPSESVVRFYEELTARYPSLDQLSEEEAEDSPWSDSIDISDGAVLMVIRWSRAGDMVTYVKALAAKHGLICYDPQEEVAHFPTALPS